MNKHFLVVVGFVVACARVSAQTPVLKEEPPVVLKAHKLERFELPTGTMFDLVLENANEFMPVALVSHDVHDFYGNVTVPRGSKLIGKYLGFKSGRYLVEWTHLQVPSRGGSLRIEPPMLGTMRDGTTGFTQFAPGAIVGAINTQEFIVPQ